MKHVFDNCIPAPTGQPVMPGEALRRLAIREAFENDIPAEHALDHIRIPAGLAEPDMRRGTLGRQRIADEVRRADNLGRFANLRDGGNLEPGKSHGFLTVLLIVTMCVAGLASIVFGGVR